MCVDHGKVVFQRVIQGQHALWGATLALQYAATVWSNLQMHDPDASGGHGAQFMQRVRAII